MSKATVLDIGAAQDLGNLDFPNLEKILERRLASIKTLPDLEKLIKLVNPFLKDERFSPDEQDMLKRLRQRAYDRKRNSKFISKSKSKNRSDEKPNPIARSERDMEMGNTATSSSIKSKTTKAPIKTDVIIEKTATPTLHPNKFAQGVTRAFTNIDGEMLVKSIPKLSACLSAAALVSFFLWHQSLDLYRSAGFTNATYAAAGGIMMIVGFAAYHSISRSWLSLLFCLYAGAYESYLMVSGTIHDDNQAHAHAAQTNPEIIFLQEKVDKERMHYLALKQRYDNPESKVHKNEWFLKNQLNPAWESNTAANRELVAKRTELTAKSTVDHVSLLKIFYRLGLVFLCMMLVHQFFANCIRCGQHHKWRNLTIER